MSEKINIMTVAQYMDVINNPPDNAAEAALPPEKKAILDKFRAATKSYYAYSPDYNWDSEEWIVHSSISQYPISYAWGSFNSILIMFQYLNNTKDVKKARALGNLFNGFKNDTKVNIPPNPPISGAFAHNFLFVIEGDEYTQTAAVFDKQVDKVDNYAGYAKLFEEILEGCSQEDSIETVIRRLEPYVRQEARAGFREMARRGFDVTLVGELWKNCEKLYNAGARQIVFTGAPGTGKTFTAKRFAEARIKEYLAPGQDPADHIETVQFHSGYDYSDFVEGLRPVQTGKNGEMTFVRLDGRFKAFCRKILTAKDQAAPYFFIIDEINRADLSRVFGELMFCLDESKRPNKKERKLAEQVKTQYSNLPTFQIKDGEGEFLKDKDDVFRDGFYIPENLCILATMNDIDRSVESFDFALRRRFKWIRADANKEMEPGLQGMLMGKVSTKRIETLVKNAIAMNMVIAGGKDSAGEKLRLTEDYHIGHAYFEKFDGENLQAIWDSQIKQILQEYCRGRSKTEDTTKLTTDCYDALFDK